MPTSFFFGIDENGDGDYYNFVFQQALVTINGGSRTVTADKAHLYTLGDLATVLWGNGEKDAFSLNITVTPNP